ncbi:MAG: cyclase family protein [Deltaproteobacteria bacterium]|nr:cyclase family protein [Deltaproteobacteria bacterium]
MQYYDISLKLSPASARWVTAAPFELLDRRRMQRGDHNNSSSVNMSVHSGTHMDAPFHFVPEGASIDELPLELFIGPALVHEVDAHRYITAEHVAQLPPGERVLFKTSNSELLRRAAYDPDFVAFSVEAADALVAKGYRLVGLDYLSVAHADEQVPVHRAFLDHGLALLEGVDLTDIRPGAYELICFPVCIAGADGAPCRAVLRDLES